MFAASALVPLLVLGHGAYPLAYQMIEKPGDPSQLAAGTSFGLLLSNDDGGTWGWVCEEAIGYGMSLQPVWYLGPDGTLFGAGFNGMYVSRDHGCTWSTASEFSDAGASDVINNGTAMFAVSQRYGYLNGIWRSKDQGMTWQLTSVSSLTEFYTTVRTAPSRPQRVYAAEWWYTPVATEAVYWSDDNGDTFNRIDVSNTLPIVPQDDGGMGPMGGAFHIFAVSPVDPDVVYGVVWEDSAEEPSYVIVSPDKGQSWSLLLSSPDQIGSLAVNDDASKIWAGSAIHLYESSDGGPFAPLPVPTRNSCVYRDGDHLYACGWPEVDGFGVGRQTSTDPGEGFTPFLTWARITGALQCPSGTRVNQVCTAYFPALRATFPPSTLGDAGSTVAPDAGCPADASCPAQKCGCDGAPILGALWGAVVLAHTLRRRRIR
jgi:hypothetical protein